MNQIINALDFDIEREILAVLSFNCHSIFNITSSQCAHKHLNTIMFAILILEKYLPVAVLPLEHILYLIFFCSKTLKPYIVLLKPYIVLSLSNQLESIDTFTLHALFFQNRQNTFYPMSS